MYQVINTSTKSSIKLDMQMDVQTAFWVLQEHATH